MDVHAGLNHRWVHNPVTYTQLYGALGPNDYRNIAIDNILTKADTNAASYSLNHMVLMELLRKLFKNCGSS